MNSFPISFVTSGQPVGSPYLAGLDCGLRGADENNCHFSWFRTAEMTAEWSRGCREGKMRWLPCGFAGIPPVPTTGQQEKP